MRNQIKGKRKAASEARLESSLRRMRDSSLRYGKVSSLTAETFLSFIYTHHRLSLYLDKAARAYGITRSAINVLTILRSTEGRGCGQQELSRLLLVSRANVTGLIDGLIRKGLVQRTPDESDRRACIVKISQKGERLLDSILPQYHIRISKIYSALNNAEKKIFNRVMGKLRITLDALEKQKIL